MSMLKSKAHCNCYEDIRYIYLKHEQYISGAMSNLNAPYIHDVVENLQVDFCHD